MGIIVTTDDFTGKYGITKKKAILGGTSNPIKDFIDSKEKEILINIFGVDMYSDMSIDPMPPQYLPLLASLVHQKKYSRGLKQMLISLIYYEYSKSGIKNVFTGQVFVESEVSIGNNSTLINSVIYNDGAKDYEIISGYVTANKSTYPLYKPLKQKLGRIIL